MEREEIHDLTAAYALDALSPEEERSFEEHLRHCERCRDEVATFVETAADLAHAAPAAVPPAALRGKVLGQVRTERANVFPLRPRWAAPAAAAGAVAACAALALGLWAASLHRSLHDRTSALQQRDRVLSLIAAGGKHAALARGNGALYVSADGRAALVLTKLPPAPSGERYEAWVIAAGKAEPAGLFAGGADSAVVLVPRVSAGSRVGVTLEPFAGSARPTGRILALSTPVV